MGINFSRALSLKYGYSVTSYLGGKYRAVSVGRVMTCVLGMVVRREREIRSFVKTPFYRVLARNRSTAAEAFDGEWRAAEGSAYYQSPLLYKENGFKKREDAAGLGAAAGGRAVPRQAAVEKAERRKETEKSRPLLYNLAELQNDCSRLYKISPDQTLSVVQELYEKKLVTYPRTDARVLSSAVAREIQKNIRGLTRLCPGGRPSRRRFWKRAASGAIGKSRYTNDKQITDHYAIIPYGPGPCRISPGSPSCPGKVYGTIVRRFLSIFYPPAVYQKVSLVSRMGKEAFFSSFRVLAEEGYLKVAGLPQNKKKDEEEEEIACDAAFLKVLSGLKKGSVLPVEKFEIREGETSPPKRYNSGSMILAMENAGQLIEDEELRSQIKGSGIGTSATRAEILKKLFHIQYLALNKKTQVITPTQLGEMVFDVVHASIRPLLNPELTASWEKGLSYVAEGSVSTEEYMEKLNHFVARHTLNVRQLKNQTTLKACFDAAAIYYKKPQKGRTAKKNEKGEAT